MLKAQYSDIVSDGGLDPRDKFAKREWIGLTHDELVEIYNQKDWDTTYGWDYEKAIEAKLKEKNQ